MAENKRIIDWPKKVGQKFGRLRIVGVGPYEYKTARRLKCLCDCGVVKDIPWQDIRLGKTRSCGCLHRELLSKMKMKHGHSVRNYPRTPTYTSWASMHQRCKPDYREAHLYWDRGIRVCERWKLFENFLKDMGDRPSNENPHAWTLDRVDNDKGYEPGNCRWATPREQNMNRRKYGRINA